MKINKIIWFYFFVISQTVSCTGDKIKNDVISNNQNEKKILIATGDKFSQIGELDSAIYYLQKALIDYDIDDTLKLKLAELYVKNTNIQKAFNIYSTFEFPIGVNSKIYEPTEMELIGKEIFFKENYTSEDYEESIFRRKYLSDYTNLISTEVGRILIELYDSMENLDYKNMSFLLGELKVMRSKLPIFKMSVTGNEKQAVLDTFFYDYYLSNTQNFYFGKDDWHNYALQSLDIITSTENYTEILSNIFSIKEKITENLYNPNFFDFDKYLSINRYITNHKHYLLDVKLESKIELLTKLSIYYFDEKKWEYASKCFAEEKRDYFKLVDAYYGKPALGYIQYTVNNIPNYPNSSINSINSNFILGLEAFRNELASYENNGDYTDFKNGCSIVDKYELRKFYKHFNICD